MKLIQAITLSSSATSITFNSIPQTFTDLVIFSSARHSTATSSYVIEFNGSTTGYARRQMFSTGAGSISSSNFTRDGVSADSGMAANMFGNSEVYIPEYTASVNKSYQFQGVASTSPTGAFTAYGSGTWTNTAAITSILIKPQDGTASFVTGSTFYLYGITEGSDGIVTTS
jgi:hypothetical protein